MIGPLRSLITVTFFSLVPLQMSDSSAPLPLASDELSLGGVVFACGGSSQVQSHPQFLWSEPFVWVHTAHFKTERQLVNKRHMTQELVYWTVWLFDILLAWRF